MNFCLNKPEFPFLQKLLVPSLIKIDPIVSAGQIDNGGWGGGVGLSENLT